MGKIKSHKIDLTNPWEVYRPGEPVRGTASIEVEGELKVRKIQVFLKGMALTKWKGFLQRSYDDDYESTEIYCNNVITVFNTNETTVLATGVYKYTFTFRLPEHGLPSSFEGSLGAIRYWIKLEVDKPFPSINDKFYKCFTVLAHIDTNEPQYRAPLHFAGQKQLSKALGIGTAGSVSANVSLDRAGYCPGEQICINLEARNQSTKDLGMVKVSLVQIVNYKAASSKDSTTHYIRTVQSGKLGKGEAVKWTDQLMPVDLVPPSSKLLTCQIITVSYFVKVEVDVPLGLDLNILVPITIGTIPLGVTLPHEPAHTGQIDNTSALKYSPCVTGYQKCQKTNSDFPNLSFYIPRTAFFKSPTARNAITNKNIGAVASPTTTNAQTANKMSNVAAASAEQPEVSASAYSKSAETEEGRHFAYPVVTHVEVPPTYEEACAKLVVPFDAPPQYPIPEPGNGSILVLLFPCVDTVLVGEAFKRNKQNLLVHRGRILAFIPETHMLPSQQTAAVLIGFESEKVGLSWLQNMTLSNTTLTSRWHALIGENREPKGLNEDLSMYQHVQMKLFQKNASFQHSKSYWDEYKSLLKQAVEPIKLKHNARTILSGEVSFACGDWSSFPAKASELVLVVSVYPDLTHRESCRQEYHQSPQAMRFHAMFRMYCSCLFKADFQVGDITQFQDV